MITGTLGKIGADIALMAQNEVGSATLVGAGRSSVMPHKANPIAAEMLVTLGHYTAGLVGTLHHAMLHENERSGVAWTLEWLTLPQLIVSTGASVRTASQLLAAIERFGSAT